LANSTFSDVPPQISKLAYVPHLSLSLFHSARPSCD
jgi:hypothetical protein